MGLDALGAECPAQPVHVDLQRGRRRVGRLLAPQRVDQVRPPEHLSAVEQKLCEQRPLLGCAERDRFPVAQHFHRSEQPELDRSNPP